MAGLLVVPGTVSAPKHPSTQAPAPPADTQGVATFSSHLETNRPGLWSWRGSPAPVPKTFLPNEETRTAAAGLPL